MEKLPSSNYKGFDTYPLVYRVDAPRKWCERHRNHDIAYSASVPICREGLKPTTEFARVFQLRTKYWNSAADAAQAAVIVGRGLIDGLVDEKVVAL